MQYQYAYFNEIRIFFVICLSCSPTFCYTTKKIETLKTIYTCESLFINSLAIINIDNKPFVFIKLNSGEPVREMKEEGSRICQTKFIDG